MAHFKCLNFAKKELIKIFDTDCTVVSSPIAPGTVGTHFWNHAHAQEGEKQVAAILCHDVVDGTFVILTSRVPGEYPLTWSFHAHPGSLPTSERHHDDTAHIDSFYKRVAEESRRLKFKTEFDLIIAGTQAHNVNVSKLVTELEKNDGINFVNPVTVDSGQQTRDAKECYDMYFLPTKIHNGNKVLVLKGKNKGTVYTITMST